ncbi:MAG: glycoside hydrolase family 5 protein [Methylobacterium sp.]|uniref:glycoside hydrolase family 5 protein n=1 Tax=Methylobacterium sp. TaxID=409 RepID=UPI0025D7578C|nr:cellulase family glycosylhydrolase [Methylobacterium sp.]MBX9934260.1 glycoside hydrolase family 5 protein [Methylobacterium sp.]
MPRLKRGINLWPWFSLTKEYPGPRTDYAWPPFQDQRPVPRPGDLRRLAAAGFDFVRIPVDPGPYLAFSGAQRSALMSMLTEAVARCLDAGVSVIVNLQINEATHYWNSQRLIASRQAQYFAGYEGLVADVASVLARLASDRVALEPVNEPPQACGSDQWPVVQMALLNAARLAASDLPLVATGACGSMIPGLEGLDPAPIKALAPVFFTFHYYEPYLFSHQGAPWMREPVYRALNNVPWPASAGSLEATLESVRRRMAADTVLSAEAKASAYDETERVLIQYFDAKPDRPFVDQAMGRVADYASRHGIAREHIILGEFGALRSDARYVAAPNPDRARYIRDVRMSAEAAGFPWAFWNLFDGMGLIDDTTRAFDRAIAEALGLRVPD